MAIKKRGQTNIIQSVLLFGLLVTLLANLYFISDIASKLNKEKQLYGEINQVPSRNQDVAVLHKQSQLISSIVAINTPKTKKPTHPRQKSIEITIYTSKRRAIITINGTKVLEYDELKSKINKGRGINVVVLHQSTGAVLYTAFFDTYIAQSESQALETLIEMTTEGRIFCMFSKDEASSHLMTSARHMIRTMGSRYIVKLGWRDEWIFVVQKGGTVFAESFKKNTDGFNGIPDPLSKSLNLYLQPLRSGCHWPDNESNRRRKEFCNKYEGYGPLCSCINPFPLDVLPEPFHDGSRLDLPVAVIASNRPHYLYRMLTSLLKVSGAQPSMVTVFIDGFHDEPLALARVLGMRAIQHKPSGIKNARISQHYKASLSTSFDLYPESKYLIILEEDLKLSVDVFSYFRQLVPVLEEEESLFCVSAWNDQGYKHSVGDPAMLYRIDTMPGLGWVLKRKIFKEELEKKWPGPELRWDWDVWVRTPEIFRGRECVIPDVSRTFHFGTSGLNMFPYFQDLYFLNHALNTKRNVKFNIDLVRKENYEKEMENYLRTAELLNHSKNPCKDKDFIPDYRRTKIGRFLAYIKMSSVGDWETWHMFCKCLKLWDLDNRGHHKGVYRFWYNGSQVMVVAVPWSPYARYKPQNVVPIYIRRPK